MEVYTLDSLLRRSQVVDTFETCIWTERLSDFGDFELHIVSTFEMRSLLTVGTRLAINESKRVMTIETVENTLDSDGRTMIKCTGRSLEALLAERPNRYGSTSAVIDAKWNVTGTPANIVRQIFDTICRNNTVQPGDTIPFLVAGSLYPPSTVAEPNNVITVALEYGTVYESIKSICDAYNLGFRLVRDLDKTQLRFDVYSGNNRTTQQNVFPAVIFSPDLDNLADISELTSVESYRNVAYVYSPVGSAIVYIDGASASTTGFQRRVLMVNASDVAYPDRTYTVSAAQDASINVGINLTANTQAFRDSMNLLLQKTRLSTIDVNNINAVNSSSGLTTAQKADITAARNVSTAYNSTEDAAVQLILTQKGNEELSTMRSLAAFDGEIPQKGSYRYAVDYELGDLTEMRNQDGIANTMRVTEQIFASDSNGDRSYPTLAIDTFITPGSWLAWDYNQIWENAIPTWLDA